MKTSEQLDKIAPALVKAQSEIPGISKDGKANYGQYITLDTLLATVKPILTANGLAVLQPVTEAPDGIGVTTRIIHTSGQWMEDTSVFPVDGGRGPAAQQAGSAITYQRRYGLAAFLGIASEEDTDGNAPGGKKPASNGNQRQPVSKPGPDPSNYIDSKSAPFREFQALGAQMYGDEWDDKRPELVSAVTKKRTRSSTELYPGEFSTLLQGLRDKEKEAS